jgi:hypothetical protein
MRTAEFSLQIVLEGLEATQCSDTYAYIVYFTCII